MRSARIFSRITTTRIGTRWWVYRVSLTIAPSSSPPCAPLFTGHWLQEGHLHCHLCVRHTWVCTCVCVCACVRVCVRAWHFFRVCVYGPRTLYASARAAQHRRDTMSCCSLGGCGRQTLNSFCSEWWCLQTPVTIWAQTKATARQRTAWTWSARCEAYNYIIVRTHSSHHTVYCQFQMLSVWIGSKYLLDEITTPQAYSHTNTNTHRRTHVYTYGVFLCVCVRICICV